MLITENELRSIIRQVIIEEASLDEGKVLDAIKGAAKKFTSKSMLKILTILILMIGSGVADAQPLTKDAVDVVQEMGLKGEDANQLYRVAGRIDDAINNKNITPEKVKKAGNELAVYASKQEIPPKRFYSFLKRLVKKIKQKTPASKSTSSSNTIDLYNSDKNPKLIIKEKDDYYYAHDSRFDFYFKARKKLVKRWIGMDQGKDWEEDDEKKLNEILEAKVD